MSNIEKILHSKKRQGLTSSEKERIWRGVVREIEFSKVPYYWVLNLIQKPMMVSLIIALVIAMGTGGVVAAADSARPGDALFGIDRAVENIRVSIARGEKKNDLRIRFAGERLEEIRNLKKEDKDKSSREDDNVHSTSTDRTVEAATVAKLFLEVVASEIKASGNASTTAQIDALINQFNSQADEIERLRIDLRKGELKIRIDSGDEENESDDKKKFEVRTDDGRIRIEVKDGEVKIKSNSGSNSNSDNNSATSSNLQSNSISAGGAIKIEADVFLDLTVVKIEINDIKTNFTTSAKTRDEVITQIMQKAPLLTKTQIEAVLDFEVENRASRAGDMD